MSSSIKCSWTYSVLNAEQMKVNMEAISSLSPLSHEDTGCFQSIEGIASIGWFGLYFPCYSKTYHDLQVSEFLTDE